MLITEITACRSCGSEKLTTVLDLGNLCISDFILPGEAEERAPLELVCCEECSLVQLRHTVDRDRLYRNYYYRSGMNESMVAALKDVVDDAMGRVALEPGDYVCDIGCNDGTLLAHYPEGIKLFGYEPCPTLAAEAAEKLQAPISLDYFPPPWLRPNQYKIVSSIAQFYNVVDPNAYVAAIKKILHPEGVWIVQMQDWEGMLKCKGVDNICHEHLEYWDIEAFLRLLDRHGLYVYGRRANNVNGGSVRYIVKHGARAGLGPATLYGLKQFADDIARLKFDTVALLHSLKAEGKTIYGVAASTKFNTLAQYYGIGPELITAIAERNPEKWGRLTVGTHIPIISEKELYDAKPDYLFACAWQFFEPFRVRYAALEEAGAKWIVPLPELKVIWQNPATHNYGWEVNLADLQQADT